MCVRSWDFCGCMCHTSAYMKHVAPCCCPHRRRAWMCDECNPPEGVNDEMALTKFGTGDVLGPDDENVKKEAANTTWTDEDTKELADENED